MASDANNDESSESSNAKDSGSGDASEASSGETSSSETSSSEVPKRKRTKSAELAAQIPKVGGDTSALFGSWDSVLGGKDNKNSDSLFAPPPVLGGPKPKPTVPSFLPPSIGGDPSPSAPTIPSVTAPGAAAPSDSDAQDSNEQPGESEQLEAESSELTEPAPKRDAEPDEASVPNDDEPESSELTEPAPSGDSEESEASKDSTEASSKASEDDKPESSELTEPAPAGDSEDPPSEASSEASGPSASTEPRTSSANPAVKGEFGAADPTQRAEDDAKAEERWKAAFAQGEPEVGKPGSAFDDEASGSAAPPQASETSAESNEASEGSNEASEADEQAKAEPERDKPEQSEAESAKPTPAKPATPKPKPSAVEDEDEGGSRGLLLVLAAAAALVLVFVFMSSSRNADKKPKQVSSDTRPNTDKGPKAPDGPKARPPSNAKTHDADKYASERKPQPGQETGTGTETGAEETGTETGSEATGSEETGAEETGTEETGGEETGGEEPAAELPAPTPPPSAAGASQRREVDDPRDPSLLPPGTSAEATKAFTRMPVSLSDGAPLGGVGRSGIHIDMLDLGGSSERENTGCDTPTASFSVASTGFVNVCIRAVHNRQEELLFIIWEKDGKVARRGKVKISEKSHAYPTRAYLQIRPEYVGSWRVRIVPEGETDTVLASAEFQISD